jgi:hypothetical protein
MSRETVGLRPEALPLPWARLSDPQRMAFREVASWLAAAVATLPRERSPNYEDLLPSFRVGPRRSSVGLVSGQRGTGKTSLLLSLIKYTRSALGRTAGGDGASEFPLPDEEDVRSDLDALRNRVVWLEPLDMDTLPVTTNTLAAILARIDRVVDGHALESASRGFEGLLDGAGEREDSLTRLERLRTDIAVAWRDKPPTSLDLDEYGVQIGRIEAARLALSERFDEILDRFGSASPAGPSLFVLPVDDIDLSPTHCFNLLQLLRLINTPRLFTLVLGDLGPIEVLSGIALAGDYARLANEARQQAFVSVAPSRVSSIIGATASAAVRKLLPPAQRVHLNAMTIEGALEYHPAPDPSQGEARLKDLLLRFELACAIPRRRGEDNTLYRFLVPELNREASPSDPKQDGNEQNGDKRVVQNPFPFPYWGIRLLEAPPRQVADLWHLMKRLSSRAAAASSQGRSGVGTVHIPDNLDRNLVELLIELLQTLLQEEPQIDLAQREAILTGFQRDAADRPFFHTDVLMVGREMATSTVIKSALCDLRVRQIARWKLGPWEARSPIPPEEEPPRHRPLLEDRTAATVMVVHDLLTLTTEGTVVGGTLANAVNGGALDRGEAWLCAEWRLGTTRIVVPWAEPDWPTFRDFDLFQTRWRIALSELRGSDADWYARAYIHCILQMMQDSGSQPAPPEWDRLTKDLGQILGSSGADTAPLATLPVVLACNLAPEAAAFLEPKDIMPFVKKLEERFESREPRGDSWCKRAIRVARADRARVFFKAGGGDLAERLLAPQRYEQRLRLNFRRVEQAIRESGESLTPLPGQPRTWRPAFEKLLDQARRLSPTIRRGLDPSGNVTTEIDISGSVAFLQDALESIDREFSASLDHPVNTACGGQLCLRPEDLRRADVAATDSRGTSAGLTSPGSTTTDL